MVTTTRVKNKCEKNEQWSKAAWHDDSDSDVVTGSKPEFLSFSHLSRLVGRSAGAPAAPAQFYSAFPLCLNM